MYGESGQRKKGTKMRQTLMVAVVLSCMWGGILAHAQTTSDQNSDDHKSYATAQASADQSAPKDDSMKIDCSSSKKKRAKHHKQSDRMNQNNDSQPDKDAPQNQVEYGGAGL
jgi:cytoskeletal protein RodZ